MTATRRISVFYGHVASNVGDLAINAGQIELLRQAFPDAELHYVLLGASKSAFLTKARPTLADGGAARLTYFEPSSKMALRYQVRPADFLYDCEADNADLVVLASGEHLFSYQHGENERNLFWRTLPALAAKAHAKRCVVLPSTFGPFEDDSSRELVSTLLELVDGFASRDQVSTRLLSSQLEITDIETLLDPAFFLATPRVDRADRPATKVLGLAMRSESWGIRLAKSDRSLGSMDARDGGERGALSTAFSCNLVRDFLESPTHRARVFVQTDADRALAEYIVESVSGLGLGSRIELVQPLSVDDYMSGIAGTDYLVSSRFHAIILAMVMGVPVLGTYFDVHGHKIPGLFELLGADPPLNLSKLSPEAAAEQARERLAEGFGSSTSALSHRIAQARSETVGWLTRSVRVNRDPSSLLPAMAALSDFGTALASQAFAAAAGKQVDDLERTKEKLRVQLEASASALRNASQQRDSVREMATSWGTKEAKRIAALKAELSRTSNVVADLRRQALTLRDRLAGAEDELRSAEKASRKLRNSARYRVGSELAAVRSRPLDAFSLPKTLVTIYRDARTRHVGSRDTDGQTTGREAPTAGDTKTPIGDTSVPADQTENDIVAAGPVEEIEQSLLASASSSKIVARNLIRASKQLVDASRHDDGCRIAQAACDVYPSESAYTALFLALQGAGRLGDACRAIDTLEAWLGSAISPSQSRRLERLKSQPAYQLTLTSLVGEASPRFLAQSEGRVCYVLHNSLPYSSGGYATRAHGLASGLRALGTDVIALTRPGFPLDIRPELVDTVLPVEDRIGDVLYRRIFKPTRKDAPFRKYASKAADALELQLRRLRPECVIVASNYMCALPALIAARRLGIPLCYEVRGFWEITRWSREHDFKDSASYKIQEAMETFVCRQADNVVTLTSAMKSELVRRGVSEEKIAIVPNACDPDRFVPIDRDVELARHLNIPEDAPVIGYIGTFVDYEGLDDLTRACGLLKEKGLRFRLLLVGNENVSGDGGGPVTDEIQQIASEYGLCDWLVMPGRVAHDEVERYYSLIDVAPFPRKPWPVCEMVSPMKPLEALSMEKAVVVSDVDALSEMMLQGEYALLFEKGNIASLAETLERLIRDAELREKMGAAGRQYVASSRNWLSSAALLRSAIPRDPAEQLDPVR